MASTPNELLTIASLLDTSRCRSGPHFDRARTRGSIVSLLDSQKPHNSHAPRTRAERARATLIPPLEPRPSCAGIVARDSRTSMTCSHGVVVRTPHRSRRLHHTVVRPSSGRRGAGVSHATRHEPRSDARTLESFAGALVRKDRIGKIASARSRPQHHARAVVRAVWWERVIREECCPRVGRDERSRVDPISSAPKSRNLNFTGVCRVL